MGQCQGHAGAQGAHPGVGREVAAREEQGEWHTSGKLAAEAGNRGVHCLQEFPRSQAGRGCESKNGRPELHAGEGRGKARQGE